ncbi:MAG: PASTA domain-containing protein [Lachnospiraceae bacterium]|nr:PASTA domain-containing protein [Lachnospiraceae bacterium]
MKRCLGCMEEYGEQYNVCPHCGYAEGTVAYNPFHINPGNVIKGENSNYTIGKVLGSGSFGVTYVAWDNVLERKVAIKEYMPSEYSTRASGQTMVKITEEKREFFSKGMEKFIEEARKLAKFEEDGIVRIFDHFYQNDTAYIVMEYLDGITLTEYLEQNGKMNPKMAVDMLMPVMNSLEKVHNLGIVHRDIAPDNIMITKDGSIKLIDFGAARFTSSSSSKSLTVLVKPGYSPEEQYRRRGDQGAHTDVYSMAATLYKMITGERPADALERRAELEERGKNILLPIRKYNRKISKTIENAIYNGMNIKIEDRTPDIKQFIEELTAEKPAKLRDQTIPLIDRLRWRPWQIVTAGIASVAVIMLIFLLSTGVIHFDKQFKEDFVLQEGMTRVPAVINKDYETANELITEANLICVVKPKEYYNAIPKDKVYKQSLNSGMITDINSVVEIWISDGPQMFDVPSVVGMLEEKAIEELTANSVAYEVNYTYSMNAEGTVIEQSHEGGSKIAKGKIVEIIVSKGHDPNAEFEEKMVTVPDLINMDYQEAIEKYGSEMQIIVEKREWSDSYGGFEKDRIMVQDIEAGTTIKNTDIIKIIVSEGVEMYEVPDVVMRTEENARAMLEAKNLKVTVEYKLHETFEKGMVISQSIEEGEFVKPDTEITIVVSTGKGSFAMEDVVGKDETKAKNLLVGLGLNVQVSYEYSDNIASGKVISQSIKAGTNVVAGDTVTLVVSSGEELFEVPYVVAETIEMAKKHLEEKHFIVKTVEEYTELQKGYVFSQSLAADTKHKKNTEIILVVSKGKQPYTLHFEGEGGTVSGNSITVYYDEVCGKLPTCTRTGFTFDGWYTSVAGGDKITETSKYYVQGDSTVYAHWTANTYTITFDPNGGTVGTSNISYKYGSVYSNMPTPARKQYTFDGWYTASSGGTKITSSTGVTITSNQTLYAHWTANQWSGWTETKPSDTSKYTIQEKTQYRYRDKVYTTSTTSSSLSGWTYDAASSYWSDYGAWSAWQDSAVSGSDSRQVETQQVETSAAYTILNAYYYRYYNTSAGTYYYTYSSSMGGTKYTAGLREEHIDYYSTYEGHVGYVIKAGIGNGSGGYLYYPGEIWFEESRYVVPATYKTQYRYRDRTFTYQFWKWGSWSSWSDTSVTATNSRDVETRKLYNYILN